MSTLRDRSFPLVTLALTFAAAPVAVAQSGTSLEVLKTPAPDADDNVAQVRMHGDTMVFGVLYEDGSSSGVGGDPTDNGTYAAGAAFVYVRSNGAWVEQAYLKASNPDMTDIFGTSVAIHGDTIVVGAHQEDSGSSGVDGDETDDSQSNAGAAYVFVRSGSTWTQEAYLKASNAEEEDGFGGSVAVWGDTIAIAAIKEDGGSSGVGGDDTDNSLPRSGAVYVFVRANGTWTQQAYLKASNPDAFDHFGPLELQGDRLVVAAGLEDSAAAGVDGDQSDDSLNAAGAVYVFERTGSTWAQTAYLKASNPGSLDYFGSSLALDGDTLAVSAFREQGGAPGVNGDQSDDSVYNAGAVYVFRHDGATWSQEAYLKAPNPGEGDEFGGQLALVGDRLMVGAKREAGDASSAPGAFNDEAPEAGAAYEFRRIGSTWFPARYVKPTPVERYDYFATGVAMSGELAVFTALGEDSASASDPYDNSIKNSGAVYTLELGAQADPYCAQTKPTSVAGCQAALFVDDLSLADGAWQATNLPRSADLPPGSTLGVFLFAHGVGIGPSGFAADVPFGTLCIAAPQRSSAYCAPATALTTPGLCNPAVLSLPLACAPDQLGLHVGEDVNVQLWYRDATAADPSAAGLSNAAFYTLQ